MITEELRREIAAVINTHSIENDSNTSDYVLAEFLTDCLEAFALAVNARESRIVSCPHCLNPQVAKKRIVILEKKVKILQQEKEALAQAIEKLAR